MARFGTLRLDCLFRLQSTSGVFKVLPTLAGGTQLPRACIEVSMSSVVFLWGIISSATTITDWQVLGPRQRLFGKRQLQMDTR